MKQSNTNGEIPGTLRASPSPGPERFSENKGGTGNLPVLAGYQPARLRQRRTVSACDAPNSAASCRRAQPGWLCHLVQLNRYGGGEGRAFARSSNSAEDDRMGFAP